MRDILITVIFFGALPYALARPHIALMLYAWISYMNPHKLTWGFAFDFPFAQIAAIATVLSLLFSKDRQKVPLSGILFIWILWVLWMNITTIFSMVPEYAFLEWERAMKIQLMAFLTLLILNSEKKIIAFIWIVTGSILFYGIKGGVFTILHGGKYIVYGPPGGFFYGNNSLAVALLMTIPLAHFLYKYYANKWIKMALLTSVALSSITILASYSRGAFLGILAISFYFILKSKRKIIIGTFLVVCLVGFIALMPQKWSDRIDTIQNYQQDGSAMGRINAWMFGWNIAKERPLIGGGYNVFDPQLFVVFAPNPDDFHDAHSIYFEALAEHGFVGLFFFLLLGIFSFREIRLAQKGLEEEKELKWIYDLAASLRISLVGYAVSGAFVGLAYFDLYYHLIALIILIRFEKHKWLNNIDRIETKVNMANL